MLRVLKIKYFLITTHVIFIVSQIEKRLQELQRKLSEIAEIPKILSSTLATVSQTFDKLTTTLPSPAAQPPKHCRHHFESGNDYCKCFLNSEQKRKLSYDEDVYDYELSDDESKHEEEEDNEEFDAKEAYLQLKRYAASQRKSKDVTPESDYASESNFPLKETGKIQDDRPSDIEDDDEEYSGHASSTDSNDDDDDDDDTEKSCDMYEEFNLSMLKIPFGQLNNESDIEQYDDGNSDEKDSENVEDFLTTTLTWNLRNKPKLQMDDSDNNVDDDYDVDSANLQQRDNERTDNEDTDKICVEQQASLNNSKETLSQKLHKADTPDGEQKVDKLERSWPWADREKIIYKQSTCHLVPHKPLGLIEKRIQLLAKRNLLEHISKIRNPQ